MAIRVFISYSHDSPEHSDRVWDLSERLRQDGIDCRIDQHELAPEDGWPRWCRNQIQESKFVLVLCTETYQLRYDGKAPADTGAGAKWEGFVITQEIYDAEGKHTKFIPVAFSREDLSHIPLELRGANHYLVSTDEGYIALLRRITDNPERRPSVVAGQVRPLPMRGSKQEPLAAAAPDLPPLPKLERKQSRESGMGNRDNWIVDSIPDWFEVVHPDRWKFQEGDKREHSSLIKANPFALDLHLSYSQGFEQGPIIQRTGDGSPIMDDPEKPGSYTEDPERQRVGTNYVLDAKHQEHSEDLFLLFAASCVLFAALPDRKDDPALESANDEKPWQFVVRKIQEFDPDLDCKTVSRSLETASIEVGNLVLITGLIPAFQRFLQENRGYFRKPNLLFFPNYNDDFREIQGRCWNLVETFYKKADYPDFVTKFAIHNEEEAFRVHVEHAVTKYVRLFLLSRSAWSHEEQARQKIGDTARGLNASNRDEIVLMQGCGDLTMNLWNVAFVSGDSCYREDGWDLLHSPDEPLNDREYTCLIKWKCKREELQEIAQAHRVVYPYQVASLRFMAPWLDKRESPKRHVFLGELPIGHLIEFAVYGKQIYSGESENTSKPLDDCLQESADKPKPLDDCLQERLRAVIPQFSDVRHIYRLPNLNPPIIDQKGITSLGLGDYRQRPRYLFNERTLNDMWLCERGLIQGDRNLRVAALGQAIHFNKRELGAPEMWIKFVLKKDHSYKEAVAGSELKRGQWRWIKEGREDWLEIFCRLNHYPCSMVGVTARDEVKGRTRIEKGEIVDTKEIFFCAHGHNYERFGCTVLEAAKFLADNGAYNILVFDEGEDVFQLVRKDGQGLTEAIPLRRKQLRCVFWATAKTSTTPSE